MHVEAVEIELFLQESAAAMQRRRSRVALSSSKRKCFKSEAVQNRISAMFTKYMMRFALIREDCVIIDEKNQATRLSVYSGNRSPITVCRLIKMSANREKVIHNRNHAIEVHGHLID
jgi:hypothetical protein